VCLLLWVIIAGLLTFGFMNSNDERIYIGFIGAGSHAWTVDDGSLYLDMIEQAQNGAWLFKNRFSPEIGPPRYLNSVWIVVGKLGGLVGLAPLWAYAAFRFIVIIPFIAALRGAIREFVKNRAARPLALVLIVFGGGLGWIFGVLDQFYQPAINFFIETRKHEVWNFLPTMIAPHHILAMALVIWIMTGMAAVTRGEKRPLWLAPLLALILATFHPYDLPAIYAVGFIYLIILWLKDAKINRALLGLYSGIVIVSLPLLAYHYWALSTAPDLRGLFLQNDIRPFSSIKYVIGLLPLGLLALRQLSLGLANFRTTSSSDLLIISWALALPVMLYSFPEVSFAWKLTIGMPLPICVLAVDWIHKRAMREYELNPSQRRPLWRANRAITYIVIVSLLSSTYIALSIMHTARGKKPPYYISRADYNALRWLAAQPGEDNTVFAARLPVGVVTPRFANKRAFMGHDHQTVNFTEKEDFGRSLFVDGVLSVDELQELRRHRVQWIYVGNKEREWWPEPTPSQFLSLDYDRDGVKIYKVHYTGEID